MKVAADPLYPKLKCTDPQFDGRRSRTCALSIQIGSEGLRAAVWDESSNKVIALESYPFHKAVQPANIAANYEEAFKESAFLHLPFKRINVGVRDAKFTFVPLPLFEPTAAKTFFEFNHVLSPTENLHSDHLPNVGAKLVFSCPLQLEKSLRNHHTPLLLHHGSSAWIEYEMLTSRYNEQSRISVNLFNTHFELMATQSGKLQLFTSFPIQNADDFIYYLMFTIEQLQFNPEKIQLDFYGEVETSSAYFQLATRYIRNVQFGHRPDPLDYAKAIADLPSHQFIELYSQFLYN